MLSQLPPEIIYLIASYLPTASALAHLDQTCRRLHEIITAEDWRIFRAFVKSRFPHIETPPFWKDVAQALTSRSRALDRHALIGRFVVPAHDAVKVGSHRATRRDNPTHGYRPAIDSYEVWDGATWSGRKEVLAWGAADEIVLRIKQTGLHPNEKWLVFNDLDHISSHDDILGVHILRPGHYSKEENKEHLIFGRMRGELVHLAVSPDKPAAPEYKQRFLTFGQDIERIDLSDGSEPHLAAHLNNGTIAFYSTTTGEAEVEAFARLRIDPGSATRNKYSKFLSQSRLAVGTGRIEDSLAISTITPDHLSLDREIGVYSLDLDSRIGLATKASVSAVAPLNTQSSEGSPRDVFLAAWGDRSVRLHDLRSDKPCEATYQDSTDYNPVYCVHPFSNDRFVVGAGGDAVVKIFDLRMPRTYNHLQARSSSLSSHGQNGSAIPERKTTNGAVRGAGYTHKDLSIFLSHPPPFISNTSRARARPTRSYRGAIYAMSSPSTLSSTIYTGIADGVVQLDFVSTDDLTGPFQNWYRNNLGLKPASSTPRPHEILELSGYERPDPKNTTQSSKLRTQQPFKSVGEKDIANEELTGWDRRWERLEAGAWRRRD